jgi:hypothetical protein
MPRTKGSKNKKTKITKTTNKNTNINNVHVHVEKTKTRKRRTTKPKEESNNNPLSNSVNAISRGTSSNLGFHPRGLINNEIQQPTIVQQIQAPPDPRLDKLDKRTKKIKEYLKSKGDTKDNAINVNSSILATPSQKPNMDIFADTIEPQKLKFEKLDTPSKKGFLSKLFSSGKKKKEMEEKPSIPLLEYKPESTLFSKRSPTAPLYSQSSIEIQTSPNTPTGHQINQELKNLVNQLHAAHPNKIHIGTFRSAITKKLRELGVDSAHSTTYVNKMRTFYDEIYAASNGIEPAGGVM